MIYSFQRFGYEGCLVNVEADLRRGIPTVDIVGMSDGSVSESRERVRAAINNAGFEFPSERVLISLSPADIRKDGADHDLALALAVLAAKDDFPRSQDTPVLVLGGLQLSGGITPARGAYAALTTAKAHGIRYAIVAKDCEVKELDGLAVIRVENLREAYDKLCSLEEYEVYEAPADSEEIKITFTKSEEGSLDTINDIRGENSEVVAGMKYAMAVAAAGRHNLIAIGSPGCGKTMLLQRLPEITPNFLSAEEAAATTRIWSIAGLMKPNQNLLKERPFRMPHQTASIEGICGGGPNCRPGEISLAHNGTLFLDEAAKFRSSVLQMLRVPLENHTITLSRAGRSTVFPADFQLVMATNPCPCGNFGSYTKICLCSAKSVEQYWKKFSAPLLDRVDIRYSFDEPLKVTDDVSLKNLRAMVKTAWEKQHKRQYKLNRDLSYDEVSALTDSLEASVKKIFDKALVKYDLTPRGASSVIKVARTIADMHDNEAIEVENMQQAIMLRKII